MVDEPGPGSDPPQEQPSSPGGSESRGVLIGVLGTISVLAVLALVGILVFVGLDDGDEEVAVGGSPSPTATPRDGDEGDDGSVTPSPTATREPTPTSEAVVLGPRGLKAVSFGATPSEAVEALRAHLGAPDEDTGWVDAHTSPFGVCPGDEVRGVRWATLFVLFTDGDTSWTSGSTTTRHFFGFSDNEAHGDGAVGEPHPLRTSQGIGRGSTVAELRSTYGAGVRIESEELGDFYFIEQGPDAPLYGGLTGTGDDDEVVAVLGGDPCGE